MIITSKTPYKCWGYSELPQELCPILGEKPLGVCRATVPSQIGAEAPTLPLWR